jgi:hypothetical protein
MAASYRPLHCGTARVHYLISEFEGNSLERGVCPGPNLVRSARAARTVALDWTAPTFRFQLEGISHIALPKPKGMRG